MKKILTLVSLLIVATACAPQPPGNNMSANANSNANKSADVKATAPPSEADIIAKEKAAWDAFRKKDADAFGKLTAPEYIEVLDTGLLDKASTIAGMKDFEISDMTFADWKMLTVDKDAVVLTYTANLKGTYKGKAVPATPSRVAAAFVNRNGEWLAIYFQETKVSTGPPPPSPKEAAKAAPKTASPAGTPGQTGPDAAANEKLVWDSFKARNYDAFASYLADNFTQVASDGIYDKAGSVKGVQMFDAAKVELSSWKTVKFSDAVSLVTYVAKVPGLPTEYHSSIWVNRNGKWVALFHMGTAAASDEGK